jgi:hypothetical protein
MIERTNLKPTDFVRLTFDAGKYLFIVKSAAENKYVASQKTLEMNGKRIHAEGRAVKVAGRLPYQFFIFFP